MSRDQLLNQQAALAEFGMFAFRTDDLDTLLLRAAELVTKGLGVDRSKVLELRPDGRFLIRSGISWRPGVVGHTVIGGGEASPPGFAVKIDGPVTSADLEYEQRFGIPDVLREHGILSMVNVVIPGKPQPYGVLEADSAKRDSFTQDDVNFLQNCANLLAAAIERVRTHEDLRAAAAEKEALLREMQHRVKNNLQVITTLIMLQMRKAKHSETRRELEVIASRVEILRIVHEKLYALGEVGTIELGGYLRDLCDNLIEFYGDEAQRVEIVTRTAEIPIKVDVAIPIALIVNEFVTNSVKHAFPQGRGRITVDLDHAGSDQAQLVLTDNGRGLPRELKVTRGSGLHLIEVLGNQIGARADWETTAEGTRISLTFAVQS